jgi:hypothetical protein
MVTMKEQAMGRFFVELDLANYDDLVRAVAIMPAILTDDPCYFVVFATDQMYFEFIHA